VREPSGLYPRFNQKALDTVYDSALLSVGSNYDHLYTSVIRATYFPIRHPDASLKDFTQD